MSAAEIAGQVTIASAGTAFMAAVGVESQGVLWATFGSILGIMAAKKTSPLYAVALFIAAAFVCALGATMVSARWFDGDPMYRNGFAAIFGAAFHPALQAFFDTVPTVIRAVGTMVVTRITGVPPKDVE